MDNIDYLLEMNFYLLFNPNNCVNLELSSNEVIIENLSLQLLYFCFKKTITYLNKQNKAINAIFSNWLKI